MTARQGAPTQDALALLDTTENQRAGFDTAESLGVVEEPVAQECQVVVLAERRLQDFDPSRARLGCRLPGFEQAHVIPMLLDASTPGVKLGSA